MLKCSSERWVCAPQSLSAGTSTSPRLSVSLRMSVIFFLLSTGAYAGTSEAVHADLFSASISSPACRRYDLRTASLWVRTGVEKHAVGITPQSGDRVQLKADDF